MFHQYFRILPRHIIKGYRVPQTRRAFLDILLFRSQAVYSRRVNKIDLPIQLRKDVGVQEEFVVRLDTRRFLVFHILNENLKETVYTHASTLLL